MIRAILFFQVLVILVAQCVQNNTGNTEEVVDIGLHIESGINRGMRLTDSLAITHISVTFTNIDTIPLHLQLAFADGYDHPHPDSDEKFKVVIMPSEWTESKPATDKMISELLANMDHPGLDETIEPGEHITVGIGTIRPAPAKICGIIPNVFFAHTSDESYESCLWYTKLQKTLQPSLHLGVKLDYCHNEGMPEGCYVIPCGRVTVVTDK